jgi:hypothetical protein
MPLTPGVANPLPFYWSFYGHSYWQGNFGAHSPAGRADSIMRSLFGMEQVSQTKNHAVLGAKLTWTGNSQGGWVRLMQNERGNTITPSYPDVAMDGAFFLGWGINDVGGNGNTTQLNNAYQMALRAVISRCRCSRTWGGTDAAFTAGASFVNQSFTWETAPGNNYYSATVTTTATLSWTIPADYKGGVITFLFLAQPGVKGATFTYGGTAGITGTTSTSNITPAGFTGGRVPVVRRITTLTSANAGQTITIAATAIDSGGTADFAGAWIESPWPPPVLVANAPRLNALGYLNYQGTYASSLNATAVTSTPATITLASGTTYGLPTAGSMTIPSAGGTVTLSWTGGPGSASTTTLTGVTHSGGSGNYSSNTMTWAGPVDADILAFNAVLDSLFSEFDGMVQEVDLDTSIAKDAVALGSDGLHPSELGAARIADTFRVAAQRLAPSSAYGEASQMNVPNRALVPLYTPRVDNAWYTTPGAAIGGTPYTPVAGDMFAIPMNVLNQGESWFIWSVETLGGSVAPTVMFGVYDDRAMIGMPQHLFANPCTGPITLPTGAAVFNSTTTGGQNGYFVMGADPGLYWLSLLIVTAGTGVTFRTIKGPTPLMPNLTSGGGGATTAVGWKMTGKSNPLPSSWDFPFTPGLNTYVDNCPLIGVKVF